MPGPFVARALLEHEAGEIACHLAVNRAGRIEGLLLAPVAAEADMAKDSAAASVRRSIPEFVKVLYRYFGEE